jgi:hypothetical protein
MMRGLNKRLTIMFIMFVVFACLLPIGYSQAANTDELIQQLNQDDVIARLHAVKALGEIKDARAVEPLSAVLKDSKCGLQAANALAKIGRPSVPSLVTALKNNSPIARRNAAKALGEIRDNSAVEPLTSALKDDSPIVRRNAALALKEIGSSDTVVVDILY